MRLPRIPCAANRNLPEPCQKAQPGIGARRLCRKRSLCSKWNTVRRQALLAMISPRHGVVVADGTRASTGGETFFHEQPKRALGTYRTSHTRTHGGRVKAWPGKRARAAAQDRFPHEYVVGSTHPGADEEDKKSLPWKGDGIYGTDIPCSSHFLCRLLHVKLCGGVSGCGEDEGRNTRSRLTSPSWFASRDYATFVSSSWEAHRRPRLWGWDGSMTPSGPWRIPGRVDSRGHGSGRAGRKGRRERWNPKSRLEAGRDGPARAWRAWRKRRWGNEGLAGAGAGAGARATRQPGPSGKSGGSDKSGRFPSSWGPTEGDGVSIMSFPERTSSRHARC